MPLKEEVAKLRYLGLFDLLINKRFLLIMLDGCIIECDVSAFIDYVKGCYGSCRVNRMDYDNGVMSFFLDCAEFLD